MANRFRHIEEPVFEEETELLSSAQSQEDSAASANDGDSSEAATSQPAPHKRSKSAKLIRKVFGGEVLTTRKAIRQIPLVMMLLLMAIIAVGNRYAVEKLRKEVVQTRKEIDELSLQQIQMKSQYQQSIKISNIANNLDSIGVKLVTEPPLTLHR